MLAKVLNVTMAAVIVGSITSGNPFSQKVFQPQAAQSAEIESKVKAVTIAAGNFVSAEHPTKGAVRIARENDRNFIEFDEAFKTDNGPDLHVILYRTSKPPVSGAKAEDYTVIARLKKVAGSQRYELPGNLNVNNFKSVAVWCRMFNATFGYAPLAR